MEGADRLSSRLFSFRLLDAAEPPDITVEPGMSPFGYFSLAGLGVPPEQDVGDETLINFSGFGSFVCAGRDVQPDRSRQQGCAVVGGDSNTFFGTALVCSEGRVRPK